MPAPRSVRPMRSWHGYRGSGTHACRICRCACTLPHRIEAVTDTHFLRRLRNLFCPPRTLFRSSSARSTTSWNPDVHRTSWRHPYRRCVDRLDCWSEPRAARQRSTRRFCPSKTPGGTLTDHQKLERYSDRECALGAFRYHQVRTFPSRETHGEMHQFACS